MRDYARPELLASDHDTDAFDCGSEAQTEWLRRHGLQATRSDTSKVYVVTRRSSRAVVGYYAITAGSIHVDEAATRISTGVGRYPVPVVVLTRLGVDVNEQGRGLGSALLADAFLQVASVADRIGVRALLIHAETSAAATFYRRASPSIVESPTNPLHLMLLMKDLRTAIREAAAEPARGPAA